MLDNEGWNEPRMDPLKVETLRLVDASFWGRGEVYCGVLSGSTFGFAVYSGRITGEYAARYIGRK